jgi:hypothetical protein
VLHELVAFQAAELAHPDAVRAADAGEVIAEQVHNHDVLGPVLLALQQLVPREQVRLGQRGAAAGSLDGAGFHLPVADAEEPFRRGADNLLVTQIEVGPEGRRVPIPQAQIEVQRTAARRIEEPLGEVDLEDVAGMDVFDGSLDGLDVALFREVAEETGWAGDGKGRSEVGWRESTSRVRRGFLWSGRLLQPPKKLLQPFLCSALAAGGFGFGKSLRDDPGSPLHMIKGQHHVVEADEERGDLELIKPRRGNFLQAAGQVITKKPGSPSLKRRQVWERWRSKRRELVSESCERLRSTDRQGQQCKRVRGEERVSAECRLSQGAVEEQAIGFLGQADERRFRVGGGTQFVHKGLEGRHVHPPPFRSRWLTSSRVRNPQWSASSC